AAVASSRSRKLMGAAWRPDAGLARWLIQARRAGHVPPRARGEQRRLLAASAAHALPWRPGRQLPASAAGPRSDVRFRLEAIDGRRATAPEHADAGPAAVARGTAGARDRRVRVPRGRTAVRGAALAARPGPGVPARIPAGLARRGDCA